MGDVYAKSSAVLACIGAQDESSIFIQDVLQSIDVVRDVPARREPWTDTDKERWNDWTRCRPMQFLRKLCQSYQHLTERPFWQWLWIVQELVGGGDQIRLLCGNSVLDWHRLRELGALLHYQWESDTRPFG